MRCVPGKIPGLSQRRGEAAKRLRHEEEGEENLRTLALVGGVCPHEPLEKEPEQSVSEGDGGDGEGGQSRNEEGALEIRKEQPREETGPWAPQSLLAPCPQLLPGRPQQQWPAEGGRSLIPQDLCSEAYRYQVTPACCVPATATARRCLPGDSRGVCQGWGEGTALITQGLSRLTAACSSLMARWAWLSLPCG